MQSPFVVYVLVGLIGFVLSRVFLSFVQTDGVNQAAYKFYKDSSFALALLVFAGLSVIFYMAPTAYDIVAPVNGYVLPTVFATAAVLYVIYWLENAWLTQIAIFIASGLLSFLLPDEAMIFEGAIPLWAGRLFAALFTYAFVNGAKNINLLAGVFGIQVLAVSAGIGVLALFGGLPLYLGMMGIYFAGIWLGFLNLNWFPSKVYVNSGTCAAVFYILAWMILQGAAEFSAPSMLILCMYFIAEMIWALVQRFILNVKRTDFSENTATYGAFEKGLTVEAIGVSVVKINVVNGILALFQLYSVNMYSVPIFAFLINLWLLGILYNAGSNDTTLKEANREFIKGVKDGFENIKNTFKNKD